MLPFMMVATGPNAPTITLYAHLLAAPFAFATGIAFLKHCPRGERLHARAETKRLLEENRCLEEELRQLTAT